MQPTFSIPPYLNSGHMTRSNFSKGYFNWKSYSKFLIDRLEISLTSSTVRGFLRLPLIATRIGGKSSGYSASY
jgi:hypothetical protein